VEIVGVLVVDEGVAWVERRVPRYILKERGLATARMLKWRLTILTLSEKTVLCFMG
jgi:hypothetical protein